MSSTPNGYEFCDELQDGVFLEYDAFMRHGNVHVGEVLLIVHAQSLPDLKDAYSDLSEYLDDEQSLKIKAEQIYRKNHAPL